MASLPSWAEANPMASGENPNPTVITNRREVDFNRRTSVDLSDNVRDVAIAQANSKAEVARENADAPAATHAAPPQEERKRDVRKTAIIVFGVLTIVGVAAVKLDGDNLAKV